MYLSSLYLLPPDINLSTAYLVSIAGRKKFDDPKLLKQIGEITAIAYVDDAFTSIYSDSLKKLRVVKSKSKEKKLSGNDDDKMEDFLKLFAFLSVLSI